ncbi:diguanylate cyclase (GGDEF)-like protein/PAS domain S-box-containing protein [Nocardioides thalensis]|uniref:Diguanylate cyclase (GGDEF)-like protein/PAS domain S-box-containing protein n=1 Tax=Nocardioides thalensis TaxID=1914755 RepID=A0A853C1Z7_9ACTN|nr:EAL domain-containing protein [Nocardioides thalensis]NYJ00618.1 diguanylate cyclase (GGDEF)-like protein/PAS domain S-box-containing protein [Nocardioides thalensis]
MEQGHDASRSDGHDQRLRLIVEAAPNAMIMVNDRGRIVLVNSEAERSFGYAREELLALHVEDLVPHRFRHAHQAYRDGFFATPDRRGMGVGRELYGLRRDGSEMPIEIGLNPIELDGRHFVLASVIDITERLRGQAAADAEREDQLRRSILDSIPFSIIATDPEGTIVAANPAAEQLLGYRRDELVGAAVAEIDGEPRKSIAGLHAAVGSMVGSTEESEWTYRRKDGGRVPVSEAIVPLPGDGDEHAGFLVVSYDITRRIEARARAEFLAGHDALTNLPNRFLLTRHLDDVIAAAERGGPGFALLLLDLDHFKRVNDSLGHLIGDELLLHVAARLQAWAGPGDLVSRLGGDEFVIVLGRTDRRSALAARIASLVDAVLAPVSVQGYELAVTGSIGAAVYPLHGGDPTTLLKHADIAMYQAKASGRDNAQWFETRMVEDTNDRIALSAALRQALGRGEVSVVYQPQVDLESGEVVGFEALARWTSPEHGSVAPDLFIPVAEDGGMIIQLGEWVLRTACADVAALSAAVGRPLRLAVNVSPRQLRGKQWLDSVTAALRDSGLDPASLEVEITEGLLIADVGDAVAILSAVRELGVSVVVDDFGQGYSSLAYLTRFPIDKIKIDRSFVEEITDDGDRAAIVDAIIVMAHALGMKVLAEGVETAEQESYLTARGCDEVQGFRYGRGMPKDQVLTALPRIAPCPSPSHVTTSPTWPTSPGSTSTTPSSTTSHRSSR